MFKFKMCCFIIVLLVLTGISEINAQNSDFEVVTGELTPFTVVENDQIYGVGVDLVNELISRVGSGHKIKVEPWKRVIVNSVEKRMSFPLVRSDKREELYKWICPLLKDVGAFAVRADDKAVYRSIEDFRHVKVGVVRGAKTEVILRDIGFIHIEPITNIKQNVKKLVAGRIDAWYEGELIMKYQLREMGIKDDQIRIAFRRPDKVTMYLVASPDISDNIINLWRYKMNEIKSDGTYRSILKKYGIDSVFIPD